MTLIAFSIHSNGKNLFDMTRNETSNSIECLNGLRSLSLLWIIFGHRFFDMFLSPATNTQVATEEWLGSIFSLSHTTFHLAVDTFFLMGGLLVTWSVMKSFDA
jgi:peptidoglycan/LPS O-acetylase OafA/YrhL